LASLYKQVFQRVHFIGQLSELSFQCSACPPALGRCCQPMLAAHRALEVSCAAVGPPGSGPVATLHAQRLLPLLLSLPPRHGGLRACIPSRPVPRPSHLPSAAAPGLSGSLPQARQCLVV